MLRRRGLAGTLLDQLEDGWARVRALHTFNQPIAYSWLYDDRYLSEVIAAVEAISPAEVYNHLSPGAAGCAFASM